MKTIKSLLFAALCLITLLACSDDEHYTVIPQENTEKENRVSARKFYYTDGSFGLVKFIYDDKGILLHKDWYNYGEEADFKEDFIYQAGRLIRIDRINGEDNFAEVRFTHENEQIRTIEYWMENSEGVLQKQHTTQFEYKDKLISKTTSTQHNGSPSYYSQYTYTNGNITSIKSYNLATQELAEETTYGYDDKPNPFYKLTDQYLGSPLASSRNNVIHSHSTTTGTNPQVHEMRYAYTYNEKGYPTEMFLIGNNNKQYLDESYTYLE